MRGALTIGVWTISLLSVLAGGALATAFGFMAAGMDPSDIIANGTQPWTDALWATAGFIGLVVVTMLSLRLWHTIRFKPVGLILTVLEAGAVAWACAKVYAEYF